MKHYFKTANVKRLDILLWMLLCSLFTSIDLIAQVQASPKENPTILKGLVLDINSDEKLFGVQITNLTTGEKAQTAKDGQFSILTTLNDQLEFRQYGYRTDTMIVIELDYKRIYMSIHSEGIRLEEVAVRGLSNQQLDVEIAKAEEEGKYLESSKERGGLRFSISRAFGEKGKQARFRHDALIREKERRLIEKRFSVAAIQALTPLDGEELEMFMVGFRPDQELVLKASDEDFRLYIMDSYSKFKKLTPDQKKNLRIKTVQP